MRKIWTSEEVSYLKANISSLSISDLANHFDVPYEKVVDKVHKLGLNSKKARGVVWTEQQNEYLKTHFKYAPQEVITELIPNKSWNAIWQHATKALHLTRKTKDRNYINYKFFDKWDEETAYIIGFILADGHIHLGKCNYMQIEVAKYDIDILQKIAKALDYKGKLYEMSNSVKLQNDNRYLIQQIANKGIPLQDKSYVAEFPNTIPKMYIRDCIRGLIDGDGWSRIDESGSYNLGLCGTKMLVEQVKNLLPVDCSTNSVRQTGPNNWRFNLKCKKARTVAKWLYKDAHIYLDRKYNEYQIANQNSPSFGKPSEDRA